MKSRDQKSLEKSNQRLQNPWNFFIYCDLNHYCGMGKSKELENGRLKNPYQFPKVKTNPIPTPMAEGWICFDLREEVWIFSISFF